MIEKYKEILFKNLQTAIELEHSTIPPYLTAFFTIDQDTNPFAWKAIRGVVMEEMLHMSLACNVMNAVGGSPAIDIPEFVPSYPAKLNFSKRSFDVGIIKFSKASIETFLEIEKPSSTKLSLKGEKIDQLLTPIDIKGNTIGQFYGLVKKQLAAMVDAFGEKKVFSGDPAKQIKRGDYYGGGGEVVKVTDLKSALFAIDTIVDQGEGACDSIFDGDSIYFAQEIEVAHYFRFNEIYKGRMYSAEDKPGDEPSGEKVHVDWKAVSNMKNNPKTADYPKGSTASEKSEEFNTLYSHLLHLLHLSFNGRPELLTKAVGMMYELKYVAQELLNIKIDGGKKAAGPSFEYIAPKSRKILSCLIPELVEAIEGSKK